jgi:CRP-like cAMP-binding protein
MELFEGCRRSRLKMIDRLGTTLVVLAGRRLCSEGNPGLQFLLLVDGLLQVQNTGGRLALLHPGAWFGEAAMIHDTFQRVSVTTVVESRVIVFDRREFNALRDIAPRVRERLDSTAELFVRGDATVSRSWYQPIVDHGPIDGLPVAVHNVAVGS